MSDETSLIQSRVARTTDALRTSELDALVLTPGADLLYLTGFSHGHAGERLLALVLRTDGSPTWIVPRMNVEQVREHAGSGQEIRGWTDAETYMPVLRDALSGARSVAFDDEARAAFLLDVMSAAPGAQLHRASAVMRKLRLRKDAAELAALRAAARTVDDTIATAMVLCVPGRTEAEIDRELRAALLARSPDSTIAFTIIASGPNGALPHHEFSQRRIEAGDLVTLDFGTRGPGGYHSDITVVCSVGEPADLGARDVYRVVYEAQQAAIRAIRPGVTCGEIDRAARSVIEAAGYGENFLHRTGHGLGLQIHEPPYLVAGSTELLEEGMVFSVEPGIYLPGRFGVRLEVIVAVSSDGASLINRPSAAELPVVPIA